MADQTFTVTLTPEQKAKLASLAQSWGADPNGGELPPKDGVKLNFSVSGNVVTFTVIYKPWYVPLAMIESEVDGFIEQQ